MPNWCDNNIRIIGPINDLQKFMADTAYTPSTELGDEWDTSNARLLARLIPMPAELEGTTSPTPDSPNPHPNWVKWLADGEITQERYDELCDEQRERYAKGQAALAATGYANWWDWQCKNWGVKWGDSSTRLTLNDDSITGTFMTPWGPPVEGLIIISTLFPTLSFKVSWKEEGGSYGHFYVAHGEMAESEEYDWDGTLVR